MKRLNMLIRIEQYDDSKNNIIKGLVERIDVSNETDKKEILKEGNEIILKLLNDLKGENDES